MGSANNELIGKVVSDHIRTVGELRDFFGHDEEVEFYDRVGAIVLAMETTPSPATLADLHRKLYQAEPECPAARMETPALVSLLDHRILVMEAGRTLSFHQPETQAYRDTIKIFKD